MVNRSATSHFIPVSWEYVADSVSNLNPELGAIINDLSPDKKFRLYMGRYDYGDMMVKNGTFRVQHDGEFYPLGDSHLPAQINEDLSYNKGTNPASILLSKQIEVFIEREFSPVPISFGLVPPGRVFSTTYILGTEHTFHPKFNWNLTAGARSTFLLPKITNKRSFKRLRKHFNLATEIPNSYTEQWALFKELNQKAELNWSLEAIYFTKEWFEHFDDPAWMKLQNYLLKAFHQSYKFWTFKFMWDMAVSFILTKQGLKPSLYTLNTVKHLLFLAAGSVVGMVPATSNDAAPIEKLQEIFTDIYNIEDYAPTIMAPGGFQMYQPSFPTYYSLHFQNSLESTIRPRFHDSIISDAFEIYALLTKCLTHLQDDDLNLHGSVLYDIVDNVKFNFFHKTSEDHQFILDSKLISKDDSRFTSTISNRLNNKAFNDNASFVRGCIRVSSEQ